jgi:hypothetical protein
LRLIGMLAAAFADADDDDDADSALWWEQEQHV